MKRRLTKKAYRKGTIVIDNNGKMKYVYQGRDTKAIRYLATHIAEVEELTLKELGFATNK